MTPTPTDKSIKIEENNKTNMRGKEKGKEINFDDSRIISFPEKPQLQSDFIQSQGGGPIIYFWRLLSIIGGDFNNPDNEQ